MAARVGRVLAGEWQQDVVDLRVLYRREPDAERSGALPVYALWADPGGTLRAAAAREAIVTW